MQTAFNNFLEERNVKDDNCKCYKQGLVTSAMGDVPAEEGLPLPPVQKTRAFHQQGGGEHIARYRGQDIHSSTHLL